MSVTVSRETLKLLSKELSCSIRSSMLPLGDMSLFESMTYSGRSASKSCPQGIRLYEQKDHRSKKIKPIKKWR